VTTSSLGPLAVLAFLRLRRPRGWLSLGSGGKCNESAEQEERQEQGDNPYAPALHTCTFGPYTIHEDRRLPRMKDIDYTDRCEIDNTEVFFFHPHLPSPVELIQVSHPSILATPSVRCLNVEIDNL
jgi:hypothetical protein